MTTIKLISALALAAVAFPLTAASQSVPGWRTDFSTHTVPLDEIVSGGPPKDGIPPIDRPKFVSIDQADRWVKGREPVVVVELEDQVRIYPIQILMWHEIVNDQIGQTPVAVTFCPLCNTALAFDRRLDNTILDFGTTGRLRHSDLVMYDRQTESWWQQASGEGIVGTYAGRTLMFVPAPLINWSLAKEAHPAARVLSRDTGHSRDYGKNPYRRYDSQQSPIRQFFRGRSDGRLPAMERVVAFVQGESSIAFPFSSLAKRRVVNDDLNGVPVAVFWAEGTASALDDSDIARGRDVGASGVFDRRIEGRTLTFEPTEPGRFKDRQTNTTWSLLGEGLEGPLAGRRLTPIPHGNHFWFAWGVFRPDTRLVR
jgi:hypothetical protein